MGPGVVGEGRVGLFVSCLSGLSRRLQGAFVAACRAKWRQMAGKQAARGSAAPQRGWVVVVAAAGGGSRWVRAPCLPLVSALNGETPCAAQIAGPGNHGDGGAENSTRWPGGSWWDSGMMGWDTPHPHAHAHRHTPSHPLHHRPLIDTQSP